MNSASFAEKRILEGYVLNRRGQWVLLAEQVAEEEKFRAHLALGEVKIGGRWRPLDTISELPLSEDSATATDPYAKLDTVRVNVSDLPDQQAPSDDSHQTTRRDAAVHEEDPTARLEINNPDENRDD
jgi:hypothetical protein